MFGWHRSLLLILFILFLKGYQATDDDDSFTIEEFNEDEDDVEVKLYEKAEELHVNTEGLLAKLNATDKRYVEEMNLKQKALENVKQALEIQQKFFSISFMAKLDEFKAPSMCESSKEFNRNIQTRILQHKTELTPIKTSLAKYFQDLETKSIQNFLEHNERLLQMEKLLINDPKPVVKVNACPPAPTSPAKAVKQCAEAMTSSSENGVYQLSLPERGLDTFSAYCLQDPQSNGKPWTIIQRRQHGHVDFYRNWNDYKEGFGNAEGEYFIGLDKIHALTQIQSQELWIKLQDFRNKIYNIHYSNFAIDNETAKYKLNSLGTFSTKPFADIDDALVHYVGQQFSTKDADNDAASEFHCANVHKGAWWYKDCSPNAAIAFMMKRLKSNLNGQYLSVRNTDGDYTKSMHWGNLPFSLKYVHMAIRPL